MNIFKVLASGRNRFSEELSSAMLAWLLNPNLEHGLGSAFAARFLESVALSANDKKQENEMIGLIARLEPVLRTDGLAGQVPFELLLEMSVGSDFIDVVLRLDNYWFSIENKIYDASVCKTKLQLRQQYDGLRKHVTEKYGDQHRIVSVFLIPSSDSCKKAAITNEIEGLGEMVAGDFGTVVAWRSAEMTLIGSDEGGPRRSVLGIIREILHSEQNGEVQPLNEYLRHTLKAFAAFIQNDFGGYPYEREAPKGGQNEKTTGVFGIKEIRSRIELSEGPRILSVGVAGSIAGLLRMSREDLERKKFQTSTFDMTGMKNWLKVDDFLMLTAWLQGSPPPEFPWEGKFLAPLLMRIAQAYGDSVYIGIQGGNSALAAMDQDEIRSRSWGIAREKLSASWIPGSEFASILEEKGVRLDD